ncbi:MAG: hypothetical protein MJ137_08320 [Clostridia bacterium]|nr:hypothetical protein [Clostridia bacterium]
MAIWYRVKKDEKHMNDFMQCNWGFHDFKIRKIEYLPDDGTLEMFLLYDELEGSVILKFFNVTDLHIAVPDSAYLNYIEGGTLFLNDSEHFVWTDGEGQFEEQKNISTWIESEEIYWAVCNKYGLPDEMPKNKIDQTWNIWGKTEQKHFELTPYEEK